MVMEYSLRLCYNMKGAQYLNGCCHKKLGSAVQAF